jgi:hypothetical protein
MSGLTISGHVVESAPRSISTVDTKKDRRKSNRKYRYSNVFELAGNNDTEALSELLEINGKIASLSSPQFATTPLHHASAHGSINTILLLLQHEADINSKDATGNCSRSNRSFYFIRFKATKAIIIGDILLLFLIYTFILPYNILFQICRVDQNFFRML